LSFLTEEKSVWWIYLLIWLDEPADGAVAITVRLAATILRGHEIEMELAVCLQIIIIVFSG
jgi:hypothetical protein